MAINENQSFLCDCDYRAIQDLGVALEPSAGPESTSSGARVPDKHVSREHTVLNSSIDRIFV